MVIPVDKSQVLPPEVRYNYKLKTTISCQILYVKSLNAPRIRQWTAPSFLCLAAQLINKFMHNDIQAQETNTQNLRLILAPFLLYLDQLGISFIISKNLKEIQHQNLGPFLYQLFYSLKQI